MKVIVIGAGAVGMSAARVLAERGHDTTLIDRAGVSNAMSSSGGSSRLWRMAHPEAHLVTMALESHKLWQRLEHDGGAKLRSRTGLFFRGKGSTECFEALLEGGVDVEKVSVRRQQRIFPGFVADARRPTYWQPEAGTVFAEVALRVQHELFEQHGGVILPSQSVVKIADGPRGITVRTDAGTSLRADRLVVAAGPWSQRLLEQVGIPVPLNPVLEQVAYFWGDSAWPDYPCVYDWGDEIDPRAKYCMPDPKLGYKVGLDSPLRPFREDDDDRDPVPARTRQIEDLVKDSFPMLDPKAMSGQVCCYTLSPDEQFILEQRGNISLGCGDSGQAFKFSPLLGELVADLAEERPNSMLQPFSLSRFTPASH